MMMFNFIRNLVLFSVFKSPVKSVLYIALKYCNLYFQVILFKELIEMSSGDTEGNVEIWFLCILIVGVSVTSYLSRFSALSIQSDFLTYMTEVKLLGRKGIGWLRPITVELWNVLDSLVLLLLVIFLAFYLGFYFLPIVIFLITVIVWLLLSKFYIEKWAINARKGNHLLFWRLEQQNRLDVAVFGSMLLLVLFSINYISIGSVDSSAIALLIIIIRVMLSTVSRQISILPRVSRYFSELPNWPQFWKKNKWV